MRAILIFIISLILGINSSIAYELVLPKEKKSIVNTNYAFFVGKASNTEDITINDEKIYIASNGAFAHSIKLKEGENRVVVKSNYNTQVYKFYKTNQETLIKPELIEFAPCLHKVKKDNTPLRSTPIDGGMNRISHLFKDTKLLVNGQKGGFYRVKLSSNKEAWIATNAVDESKEEVYTEFISMNSKTYKNASEHTIEFTENIPYTIEENDKEIFFKVYNPFTPKDSVYTINIPKPEKYTYKTSLVNGKYVFKVNELPFCENNNLENITIVIDAGHGGSENGAIGCLGDKEKDINLSIAEQLKEQLCILGATVVMTRECDANVSLNDRVKIAHENLADIFISIHLNSIPDIKMNIHKNKGTSVYYYNQNSKDLASIIHEQITSNIGTRKDGVKEASFAVLRPTEYIGALIEVAYMTNPIDSVLYTKEGFSNEVAKSITNGLLDYLKINKK